VIIRARPIFLCAAILGACSRPSACARVGGASAPEPSASKNPNATPPGDPESAVIDAVRTKRGGAGVSYIAPSEAELVAFGAWARALARAAPAGAPPTTPPPQGFVLETPPDGSWWLAEAPGQRRGSGLVVIRPGRAGKVLIEAPHTFFDVGTLEVAITSFEILSARALLVNTVRRSQSDDGDLDTDDRARIARSGEADSDLAHAPESFFTTAHVELLSEQPDLTIQLHGFRDDRLPDVDVVLSRAGTNARLESVAAALRALLGAGRVVIYPEETKHFGAMTNVQAGRSVAAGAPFIHVEMSRSLRDQLKQGSVLRRRFAEALGHALDP